MSNILHINKCKNCKTTGILTEHVGGWSVACYYSDIWNAAKDKKPWCIYSEIFVSLFDTPNDAILDWNNRNKNEVL